MAPLTLRYVAKNKFQKLATDDEVSKSNAARKREAKAAQEHATKRQKQDGAAKPQKAQSVMLPAALADGVQRLHLTDAAREAATAVASASMSPSAEIEMPTALSATMPTASTAQGETFQDDDYDLEESPIIFTVELAPLATPSSDILGSLAESFFDPARAKLEQLLSISLVDLNQLLRDPDLFRFVKVCFTFPNGRERYHAEDQGTWYSSAELQLLLINLFTRRLTMSAEAITRGCKVDNEQPFDHVLAQLITYLLAVDYDAEFEFYSPTYYVEDASALHAFNEVVKKQVVLHVIKDGQAVAAQADPRVAYVHYQTRQSAAEGYRQWETVGHDSYHCYARD
ncbi:hypothetical protein LTR36_008101 [Oleoguttula mirabilis]|uniref:Uncharacterized protein n=1 Tax=Oleoguttula mirabilis TaxID=1507867 RepID=A0AAV9J8R0_9PEZI|nr:hypothetical protein LTR36_008101 [Oleoguttula mirabilis]